MSTRHQELVKQYRQMIENNPTRLNLRLNDIGVKKVNALAAALSQSSLTTLNLWGSWIGDEGAKALAAALPVSSLTTLNLRYNCIGDEGVRAIGDEGVKALAAALPSSSLTTLNLQDNCIGGDGVIEIAASLPSSSLTMLNISYNCIGDEGAKALADTLLTSSLTKLDLGMNGFGTEGAKALAAVLPTSLLTILDLWRNDIRDEGEKSLKEAVLKSGCRVYRTGIDKIDEMLKPREEKFLAAANRFLPGKYIDKEPFNQFSDDEKITLLFEKLNAIKCHNQFIQYFMGKGGDCTRKIVAFLPIKELSQHIMSFVYPGLSSQDITEAWAMAEDTLVEMTEQNNPLSDMIDTTQPTRMTG